MRDDMKDLKKLLWVLIAVLALNAGMSCLVAYTSYQASLHATRAEDILNERTEHILRIERCACGEK